MFVESQMRPINRCSHLYDKRELCAEKGGNNEPRAYIRHYGLHTVLRKA
jgi:hypothetical protein